MYAFDSARSSLRSRFAPDDRPQIVRAATQIVRYPAMILALLVLGCAPSPAKEALSAQSDWCPEGFEAGAGDSCYWLPQNHTAKTPILLYAHTGAAPTENRAEWTQLVAAARGQFALVLVRGRNGACGFTEEVRQSYCWPQGEGAMASAREVVASWDKALWQVDQLLDGSSHPRVLVGNREGAAFLVHVAEESLLSAKAFMTIDLADQVAVGNLATSFESLTEIATKPHPALQASVTEAHKAFVRCTGTGDLVHDLTSALEVYMAGTAGKGSPCVPARAVAPTSPTRRRPR
jgi:hypothetical protein